MTKNLLIILLVILAIITLKLLEKVITSSDDGDSYSKLDLYDGAYRRASLLSISEKENYDKILPIAQNLNLTLFINVRLADVVEPTSEGKKYNSYYNKVKSKKCDFVFCNNQLDVIAVVELNDASKDSDKNSDVNSFIDFILEDSGIKVLRYYKDIRFQELENVLRTRSIIKIK